MERCAGLACSYLREQAYVDEKGASTLSLQEEAERGLPSANVRIEVAVGVCDTLGANKGDRCRMQAGDSPTIRLTPGGNQ